MLALVLLGALLVGVVVAAARVATAGLRALPLDPALLQTLGPRFGEALAGSTDFAFEPLREASQSPVGRIRNAWLAEADGTLAHRVRVPVAELRACAKVATAGSFCLAAWTIRAGLVEPSGPSFDLGGPLGRALACVALGFVSTGVVASIHRSAVRLLRDDRNALVALVKFLDTEENVDARADCRA